jgi:hypothetical protein
MFEKKPGRQVILGIGVRNEAKSMPSNSATLDDNQHMPWSHPNPAIKTSGLTVLN